MVKILRASVNRKGYNYIYDNPNFEEANYIGTYNDEGRAMPEKTLKSEKKPVEWLYAKSKGKRYVLAREDKHIEAVEMKLEDGRIGYWFNME